MNNLKVSKYNPLNSEVSRRISSAPLRFIHKTLCHFVSNFSPNHTLNTFRNLSSRAGVETIVKTNISLTRNWWVVSFGTFRMSSSSNDSQMICNNSANVSRSTLVCDNNTGRSDIWGITPICIPRFNYTSCVVRLQHWAAAGDSLDFKLVSWPTHRGNSLCILLSLLSP